MPSILLEFTIVDERNHRLWVRDAMDFDALQALASFEVLQARFPATRMFLQAVAIDAIEVRDKISATAATPFARRAPRRLMLRCPNLKTASLRAEAMHGVEPGVAAAVGASVGASVDQSVGAAIDVDPTVSAVAGEGALTEVEVWHRRRLIRHLNYPGLSFATEAPEHVARADFEPVACFLATALQPLNAVFRMSQNTGHSWLPGEDRRSTSIGDVMVLKGPRGTPDAIWMVMVTGFDPVTTFD